jgi:hypothetical protein
LLHSTVSPNEDRATVQAGSRRPLERGSGSNPEQPTWDLLRTDWQWDAFFSEHFALTAVSITPPVLHIHISFIYQGHYINLAIDSSVVYNTSPTSAPNCGGGGRDSPWVLGTSIYEGIELYKWGNSFHRSSVYSDRKQIAQNIYSVFLPL